MVTPLKTLMGFSVHLNVQLKFYNLPYLKNGFRFSGIKKDFFDEYKEQIISNGVVLKDMVLLTKKL
ncbi:hypothetical protein JMO19_12130 [Lactiplantibacillus plantarum]|uniref:hypothetical protein n=1 Tax=Lactiplantibacillus plantarum TaxID=1590 RepID=UPI00192D6D4D|nr:hypothetical protein [Lactiplantibacillus plantarum]QRA41101.1 hypothetical protein JMO19_12130 [Lactiplantibacillus plantarum]